MTPIQVAMINASKLVTAKEARHVLAALQTQMRRDCAPAWGIDAELLFVPRGLSRLKDEGVPPAAPDLPNTPPP